MCQFQLQKAWPTCRHSERLALCVCQQKRRGLSVCQSKVCEPTCSFAFGAVGVLDGQLELLDEIGAIQTALLPDVQQSLHVLLAALI